MIDRTDVESYLIGYLPYLAAVDSTAMTAAFTKAIATASRAMAGALQVEFEPTIIKMKPAAGLEKGWTETADYQIEEAPLSFVQGSMGADTLPIYVMRRRPIISVESMRFVIGATTVFTVPSQWLQLDKTLGTVSILPDGATAASLSTSSPLYWVPLLQGGVWRWRVIPNFICIDYTAGWNSFDTDPETQELREMLAQCAAADVLKRTRHLIPDSVNLEGFQQQFGALEQHLQTVEEERKKFVRRWRAKFSPPIIGVI